MVGSDDRSERIDVKLLEELDKIKVNRKMSYSKRISLLFKYSTIEKKKFNKWLQEELDNGSK